MSMSHGVEMNDTVQRINAMDERYRKRTAGIGGRAERARAGAQVCWWAGCGDPAYAKGVCKRHHQRLHKGSLFRVDVSHLDVDTVAALARRFFAAAEVAGVSPEELMVASMITAIEMAEGE